MAKRTGTRAERREQLATVLLAEPGLSNREVARRVGSDHKTAGVVRAELERTGEIPARTRRRQGHGGELWVSEARNGKALRHGAYSEPKVAPLRERHLTALRERFDAVDERLLAITAHRMAQFELVTGWLDGHGIVKGRGDVFPAAQFAERLGRNFEQQFDRLTEIQREARRVDPYEALEAHLAEIAESNGGDS